MGWVTGMAIFWLTNENVGSPRFPEGYPKSAPGVFHPMVTCKPPRAQYNDAASLRHTYSQICDAPHRFS